MGVRGWVYIISNEAMPGLIKVGYSTKDPVLRADELSHTGSPREYVVEYDLLVTEPRDIEQKVHQSLANVREGKEWFRCKISHAVETIRSLSVNNRLPNTEYLRTPLARKGYCICGREKRNYGCKCVCGRYIGFD